jgi:N-acetyl-alpha-D-glucosaminyl L-malate synthase BshA
MLGRDDFRIVTTLHGTDITLVGQDPSFRPITQFSIARSDGITAVSEWLREETVRHFDMAREAIRVIPNFVDMDVYRRDAYPCHRAKFSAAGEFIVGHVSNFRPVKRAQDAVRVFARMAPHVPARLLLVGDGPERPKAQQVAEEEGVADRVVFLGKQASVAELLACTDLYLLTSESESFALASLEAMACGVPVVGTGVGGVPEVVREGAGILHTLGDLEGMAASGVALLRDSDRWQAFSTAARAAAEKFSADRVVPVYERYYQEILSR